MYPSICPRHCYLTSERCLLSHLLRRNYVRKSREKDMDFVFPHARPAEVLYGNLESLKNRLELFSLLKMKKQLDVDMGKLRGFRQKFTAQHYKDKPLVYQTQVVLRGGMKGVSNPEDRKVKLVLVAGSLPLSKYELHKLKLLCGPRYHQLKDEITITCDSLPFKEQNKKWIQDTLEKLLAEAKVNPERFKDLPLVHRCKRKRILIFPKEWRGKWVLGQRRQVASNTMSSKAKSTPSTLDPLPIGTEEQNPGTDIQKGDL